MFGKGQKNQNYTLPQPQHHRIHPSNMFAPNITTHPFTETTAYAWFRKVKFTDLLNYTTPDIGRKCLVYVWQLHSIGNENLRF